MQFLAKKCLSELTPNPSIGINSVHFELLLSVGKQNMLMCVISPQGLDMPPAALQSPWKPSERSPLSVGKAEIHVCMYKGPQILGPLQSTSHICREKVKCMYKALGAFMKHPIYLNDPSLQSGWAYSHRLVGNCKNHQCQVRPAHLKCSPV